MFSTNRQILDNPEDQNDELLEEIKKAIKEDKIKLPAMPDIAMKIRDAFKDEQYDIMQIARVIQAETGLAAYVLKIANSPLHRGPLPIKTAKHAVCRLGQHSVQSIVLTYTMRSLFETSSSELKSVLLHQWQRSTSIAAISAILAERCDDFDPDQALLAGLLQDIGCLPLIDWLKGHLFHDTDIEAEFKSLSSSYAAQIGELILRSWQFSGDIVEVAKSRENWRRDSGKDVDVTDIVTIARHHYYMSIGEKDRLPSITDIPAFHKLPFKELTTDQSLEILEVYKEDIEEIRKMLA
jgi:HD-like signal output (HDOD) protein